MCVCVHVNIHSYSQNKSNKPLPNVLENSPKMFPILWHFNFFISILILKILLHMKIWISAIFWSIKRSGKWISPYIYDQMIFDKDAKTIQWERTVFSENSVEKLDNTCRRMNLSLPYTTYKINLRWIEDQF